MPRAGAEPNRLPRWLREQPPRRLTDAVNLRSGADDAARILWSDVADLVRACDALAREPDRERELLPRALAAAERAAEQLPVPPHPATVTGHRDSDDSDVMIATLVNSANALIAVLTAPADARDLMTDVTRAVHDLRWLLGLWNEQVEWTAQVVALLRADCDAEPP